uniref:Uncharacterized protein n=1 Tax=Loigolactobacillus rennini TaxID=238013 RepID=A0A1K2I9N1_9LACO|nr:hypothetical protein LREN565_2190 [Loigolactobacillus rennini]
MRSAPNQARLKRHLINQLAENSDVAATKPASALYLAC